MNFKKNGIFGRREDTGQREPEYEGYGTPSQVLAVWGSPGSGKTTVAVKLAKYLAGKKKNVILLLCDMTAPMLPSVRPESWKASIPWAASWLRCGCRNPW